MIDFERSCMNAFKYHFPAIIITCCLFHLAQNFFKKLVECGFKSQYGSNTDLKKWFIKFIALSLITPMQIFPISMWNHYESDDRTNNAGEAYNLRVNNYFGTHPPIWIFIKKLKEEESNTVMKFKRIENGTINRRGRNREDMEKDEKINKCKIKYLQNKINIIQYLEEISELIAPKFD